MSEQILRDTTLKVKMNTRDRLAKHGSKDQTYDNLINELLDKVEFGDSQ
jgi:hypothetical protein